MVSPYSGEQAVKTLSLFIPLATTNSFLFYSHRSAERCYRLPIFGFNNSTFDGNRAGLLHDLRRWRSSRRGFDDSPVIFYRSSLLRLELLQHNVRRGSIAAGMLVVAMLVGFFLWKRTKMRRGTVKRTLNLVDSALWTSSERKPCSSVKSSLSKT